MQGLKRFQQSQEATNQLIRQKLDELKSGQPIIRTSSQTEADVQAYTNSNIFISQRRFTFEIDVYVFFVILV